MSINTDNIKSGKNITFLSIAVFMLVVLILILSTFYINNCINEEEKANYDRNTYRQLGLDLADASDYLTSEVRLFSITHDIQHLYNYWNEIYVTKTRDKAIETFEKESPVEEEISFLKEAKKYSDLLIKTETYSMKLAIMGEGWTADNFRYDSELYNYVSKVMQYDIKENVNKADMKEKAILILYDENYDYYKNHITGAINSFQKIMNDRLDNDVAKTKSGTQTATIILVVSSCFTMFAIGGIFIIFHKLYINPIKKYTESIYRSKNNNKSKFISDLNVNKMAVKMIPDGAKEVKELGIVFNRLIDTVHSELFQRRKAEENMRRERNRAKTSNRSKSVFMAQMSHEMRTSLNAVSGYSELLLQTELNEKQNSYVNGIYYSVDVLLGVVNDILDYTKFESHYMKTEKTDFDFPKLLSEVYSVMKNQADRKNLYLVFNKDSELPEMLVGDSLKLRQVLINLISNAVKFTSDGGVTVNIRLKSIDKDKCTIYFEVRDTGTGMDEKALQSVFRPYIQSGSSSGEFKGTGLGLPICQQIVSALSGGKSKIEVESQVGKGSVFYFSLEFFISTKSPVNTITLKPTYKNEKVLVTDDNEVNVQIHKEILANCGLEVFTAYSGNEALEILRKEKNIKLIFMDVRMPDMDGFETVKKIRQTENYKTVPVIALTADVIHDFDKKAAETGMTDYLTKPFKVNRLYSILQKYLPNYQTSKTVKTEYENKEDFFDSSYCCENSGLSQKEFYAVLNGFIECNGDDCTKIRSFISTGDFNSAENIVHTLKGISGSIGCQKLSLSSQKLMEQLRNKNYDEFKNFEEIFNKTLESIKNYMQSEKQADKAIVSLPPDFNIKEVFAEIKKLSEKNDVSAIELFNENIDMIKMLTDRETFDNLKKSCDSFDFKGIIGYINRGNEKCTE
ncbi:MAG: response regulator [Clostridia bacterium]|nr:response regulator [Clostridia bacterium]